MADNSADERKLPNYKLRFLMLLILTVICIFVSFAVGRFSLDISTAAALMYVKILSMFDPHVVLAQNYADYSVIFNIRFPRIVAALLVGSALSVAGAAYQGMFQNPLVSPDILGASAGAGFGAAVAILFGLGSTGIMVIAFFGGLAGIIGQTRLDKANTVIPGVAIATALMPPLCTCGYAIANGRLDMLLGAGYLFIINAYFIFLSASIILSVLKIPKVKELSEKEWRKHRFRMVRNTLIVAIPSIVAVYYMVI